MIKLIRKVNEGESWTGSIIGWKVQKYLALDDSETTALRLSLYLGFVLIKMEFVWLKK